MTQTKGRLWLLKARIRPNPRQLRTYGAAPTPAAVEFRPGTVGRPSPGHEPVKFSLVFEEGKQSLTSFLRERKDRGYKKVTVFWMEGNKTPGHVEDVFEKRMLVTEKDEIVFTVEGIPVDAGRAATEEEIAEENREIREIPVTKALAKSPATVAPMAVHAPEVIPVSKGPAVRYSAPASKAQGLSAKVLAEAKFLVLLLSRGGDTPATLTLVGHTKEFGSHTQAKDFCLDVMARITAAKEPEAMLKALDWFSNA